MSCFFYVNSTLYPAEGLLNGWYRKEGGTLAVKQLVLQKLNESCPRT